MRWSRVTVSTSWIAVEAIANYMFEQTAIGLEIKDDATRPESQILVGYFLNDGLTESRVRNLRGFIATMLDFGIDPGPTEVRLKSIGNKDWSSSWRSAFPPQKIGKRIVVVPTWHVVPQQSAEKIVIRLDPGMAFGTGHHPTTKISIQLLEELIGGGEIVADIGTGSGILSIVAAKLGAARVMAVDVDRRVIPIAENNAEVNDVSNVIKIRKANLLEEVKPKYDLIVANITTEVLVPLIGKCPPRLAPGGQIILSGIAQGEMHLINHELKANRFKCTRTRKDQEWIGVSAELRN